MTSAFALRGRLRTLMGLLAVVAIVSACGGAAPGASAGGGATGAPENPGGDFCALLGPGDFAAAGISGAGAPTKNSDDPSNAYCVYAGTSAATGGIELDVFVEADATDAESTYDTVVEAMTDDSATTRTDVGDVDAAEFDGATEGTFAAIAVRKGKLVFTIGAPASDAARTQLIGLAKLVLQRASGLT